MIQLLRDLYNFDNQLRQYRPLLPITTPIITTKRPILVIPTTRPVITPSPPLGPEFMFGMSQLQNEMNKMKTGVKYPTCKYLKKNN